MEHMSGRQVEAAVEPKQSLEFYGKLSRSFEGGFVLYAGRSNRGLKLTHRCFSLPVGLVAIEPPQYLPRLKSRSKDRPGERAV